MFFPFLRKKLFVILSFTVKQAMTIYSKEGRLNNSEENKQTNKTVYAILSIYNSVLSPSKKAVINFYNHLSIQDTFNDTQNHPKFCRHF